MIWSGYNDPSKYKCWKLFRSSHVNFADFEFFRFRGKNIREFGFQALLVEMIFRGFHVQYLKVTKTEAIWSFSLHRLQPISMKFSNVIKRSKYLRNFVGGSLFSRDLIIRDQIKKPAKFAIIRSHVNLIPHVYFQNSFFFKDCILNQLYSNNSLNPNTI